MPPSSLLPAILMAFLLDLINVPPFSLCFPTANEYTQGFLYLNKQLMNRGMQIRTTMRYLFVHFRIALMKKQTENNKCVEEVEKIRHLCTSCRNMRWCSHYRRQRVIPQFLKKINVHIQHGLKLMTLKSRFACSTYRASQAPLIPQILNIQLPLWV